MITETDIAAALAKSAAYDSQHAPKPSKILIAAWVEHFAKYASAVTRADLLEAVTEYHREPHDRILQPADLSSIARVMRGDRLQRSDFDSDRRHAIAAAGDAKSGFPVSGIDDAEGGQPMAIHTPEHTAQKKAHQTRLQRILAQFNADNPDDVQAARYLQNLAESPLRVGCPWCGKDPGQPCVIPGTRQKLTKIRAHPSRIEAAEKQRANT